MSEPYGGENPFFGLFLILGPVIVLSSTRHYIPRLFTNDPDVIELTAKTLPLNAAFQLFDALAALCKGILRGLGRQEIGGYINLFAYYVVSLLGYMIFR